MKTIHHGVVAVSMIAAISCAVGTVNAYGYSDWCELAPVVWPSSEGYHVVRNTCSIPNGSNQDSAFRNAINQIRSSSVRMEWRYDWPSSYCTVNHGDGWDDAALVARASIGGANGLTIVKFDSPCLYWNFPDIVEADVMVANDLPFLGPTPDGVLAGNHGRLTFIHEFMHGHGIGHDNTPLNIMRTPSGHPFAGGSGERAVLFPDDQAALHDTYWSWRVVPVNSFVSGFTRINGNTVENHTATRVRVCRGSSFIMNYTIANMTPVSRAMNSDFSMFAPPFGSNILLGFTHNISVAAHSTVTLSRTLTVPATTPNALYWVRHENVISGVTEDRTSDNRMTIPMEVLVDCP